MKDRCNLIWPNVLTQMFSQAVSNNNRKEVIKDSLYTEYKGTTIMMNFIFEIFSNFEQTRPKFYHFCENCSLSRKIKIFSKYLNTTTILK